MLFQILTLDFGGILVGVAYNQERPAHDGDQADNHLNRPLVCTACGAAYGFGSFVSSTTKFAGQPRAKLFRVAVGLCGCSYGAVLQSAAHVET